MSTAIKTERSELLAKAKSIALRGKNEGRSLTTSESAEVKAAMDRVSEIDAHLEKAQKADATMAKLAGMASGAKGDGLTQRLCLSPSTVTQGVLKSRHFETGAPAVKSLLTEGSDHVGVPQEAGAYEDPMPAGSFLEVIDAKQVEPIFTYLRQVTRDNQAAPVAPGDLKPTSTYSLEEIEQRLKVIAHLSEPIDELMLEDNGNLIQFVTSELGYGIVQAAEQQVLYGDGVGANLTGITKVSGIQQQAFDTDAIVTTRKALTAVETLGLQGQVFVMHPSEFEALELMTNGDGEYLFAGPGAPVDRASRRLWGVPVALSMAVTAGEGFLIGTDSVALTHDGQGLRATWGRHGDDFGRNQVRARVEGRFGLQAARPNGIVQMELVSTGG